MTQLEHELGTALVYLIKVLEEADPRQPNGTLFNGHKYEASRMAMREYLIQRTNEGFVSECHEDEHLWCADSMNLNHLCAKCGIHRPVDSPFKLHPRLRNKAKGLSVSV